MMTEIRRHYRKPLLDKFPNQGRTDNDYKNSALTQVILQIPEMDRNTTIQAIKCIIREIKGGNDINHDHPDLDLLKDKVDFKKNAEIITGNLSIIFGVDKTRGAILVLFSLCEHLAKHLEPKVTIENNPTRDEKVQLIRNVLLHPIVSGNDSNLNLKDKLIADDLNVMFTQNNDGTIKDLSLVNNSYLDLCHIENSGNVRIGAANNRTTQGYFFNIRDLLKKELSVYDNVIKQKILSCFDNKSQELDLSNCNLTTIPDKKILSKLSLHLEYIDLSRNQISEIPENTFSGLIRLQMLDLSGNQISEIPENRFAGLNVLQSLYLYNNQISKIDKRAFESLIRLQKLNLSDNQISEIPENTFVGLTSLQILNLSNNQISKIEGNGFAGMTGLQNLFLSNNQISEIPENTFSGLNVLQSLNLSHNQISEISENTFAVLIGLQSLDLLHNQISEIPKNTFAGLTSLKVLYLSNNQISEIPENTFAVLIGLQNLYLSNNQISKIDERAFAGLNVLQSLDLCFNKIIKIEGNVFAGLNVLQSLYLYNNQISKIDERAFESLIRLQKLELSNNQISEIPENIFAGLNVLQEIDLSNNQISEIPENIFAGLTSLQKLYLSNNQISELPENTFAGLTFLQNLYLSDNKISAIPENTFAGLIGLESLILSNNQITKLEGSSLDTLLYKIHLNEDLTQAIEIDLNRIIIKKSIIVEQYINTDNNSEVRELCREYCLKLLLNEQLQEPEAIKMIANEIYNSTMTIEWLINNSTQDGITPIKLVSERLLDLFFQLFSNHNLPILPFLAKNRDHSLMKEKKLQTVIGDNQLIIPLSAADIQELVKNELTKTFNQIKNDIDQDLLSYVINIFTTGSGVVQLVDSQMKEEITQILASNGMSASEEEIDDIMIQVKMSNHITLISNGANASEQKVENGVGIVENINSLRIKQIIKNMMFAEEKGEIDEQDKARLVDELIKVNKDSIQRNIVSEWCKYLGIECSDEYYNEYYNTLKQFCNWESVLSKYKSLKFKELADETMEYINEFKDHVETYSSLIPSCSPYLTSGCIKDILKTSSSQITPECKEKLQVIIKYAETYDFSYGDPTKALFINSNPPQVLLIEELSHLNPRFNELTLEKVYLITFATGSNPEKTPLNANNLREIEAKLPVWLAEFIKQQLTVANAIAKIVDKNFTKIMEDSNINLTKGEKDKLTSIFYANSKNLGVDLGISVENKKSIMVALKDQQVEYGNLESGKSFFSSQFAEAVENCTSKYKEDNKNFKVATILDDELRKLPEKLMQLLQAKAYFKSIKSMVTELEVEFIKYEQLSDIKEYEIYYLLNVYFANLASIAGLGYHVGSDNRSFQRFRLYAAICLSQCVISAKDNLSASQKFNICKEIKNLLFTSECAGQIANRLYGQYSSFNKLSGRMRMILDTRIIA